ncbi:MAG: hypothetical protein SNF93_01820 [Rikenellaceae bacterium]
MRFFSLIIVILFACNSVHADNKADEIFKESMTQIESLNPYKANIKVSYANNSILGFYEVDNNRYYISIDQQELYGDAKTKYEVFNNRKEIIIDSVAPSYNGNLLSNPATAFTSIRDHYSATIIADNESCTTVNLKLIIGGEESTETIELVLSKLTKLPTRITYKFDDEAVVIDIIDISKINSTITSYDSSKYSDYEVIDFR